ncbi:hypothetical protein [Persicitalea jodogahamensis]|uniref:DUF3365 domain-containing protein n=1 Tax=Persicitalea jodogahamensis TaxID=402147 RepID=A0A8J3D006_9BACT|nr:hypothetical protein [Persicitalea jodogahamensis]GHB51662.1 hypothetical protein GCM10007390_00270 [Persicitalea jodogahamensis]
MKVKNRNLSQPSVLLLLLVLAAGGCNTDNRIDQTKALKEEIAGSKIRRVTDAQLVAAADEWGKEMAVIIQKGLEKELAQHPDEALKYCANLGHVPLIATIEKQYVVNIQLLGILAPENPTLAPKERELLGAYVYNAEKDLPQFDNVQKLNDTLLVYNAPVPKSSPICKECFPDQKLPFAVWRVIFDKKEVIKKLQ